MSFSLVPMCIIPNQVKVFKDSISATTKTKKKPNKKEIGIFYAKFKRPLSYLFILLGKPRKSASDKEEISDLLKGLRKAEKAHQKEYGFSDSIVDILIEQRDLKIGKLE